MKRAAPLDRPFEKKIPPDILALTVLALSLFAFFFPMLFQGKTFFFRDVLHFAYPIKYFLWRSFQNYALPLWWNDILGGTPFLALLHTGVFYPVSLIFFLPDFSLAFKGCYLVHFLILGFSVYQVSRYWEISPAGALAAALTAVFGGFFLSVTYLYSHFQSSVWLPWIFLYFHKYLDEKKFHHLLAGTLFLACQLLAGSPEYSLLTLLALAGFCFLVVPGGTQPGVLKRKAVALTAGLAGALGLAAVQFLPTYFYLQHSIRAEPLRYETVTQWSMTARLASSFILPPNLNHFMLSREGTLDYLLTSAYMGVFPVFFLLAGITRGRHRETWFWIGLFAAGIFFAFGNHNPLFILFYKWVPFFDKFRYPEKFLFLSAYGLVFLTAYGVDALKKDFQLQHVIKRGVVPWVLLLGLMVLAWFSAPEKPVTLSLQLLLLFGVAGAAACFGKLKNPGLKITVLILLMIDLGAKNWPIVPLIDKEFYERPPPLVAEMQQDNKNFRIFSGSLESGDPDVRHQFPEFSNILYAHFLIKERLRPNLGTVFGLQYLDGLAGLHTADTRAWWDIFKNSTRDQRIRMLKRGNVQYWITGKDQKPPSQENPLGRKEIVHWNDALPRAFLVPRARGGGDAPSAQDPQRPDNYYSPEFDPRSEVLLMKRVDPDPPNTFSGRVESLYYASPNRVELETRQNAAGYLVLLDTYAPGWQASVDDQPAEVLRADYFYRAVRLDPGFHRVVFIYQPEGFRAGGILSAVSLLLMVGLYFRSSRSSRFL